MAGRLHVDHIDLATLCAPLVPRIRQPLVRSPNLAPRRPLSMLRFAPETPSTDSLELAEAFWGLTPAWLEVLDHAPHCARAESLEQRPMFREAFLSRRCAIPVTGIYAWVAGARGKQPFLITRVDRSPLLLAAIWCGYPRPGESGFDSTALVTVPTQGAITPLSDRLPALLDGERLHAWLSPSTPMGEARALLAPAAPGALGAFPVERAINDPRCQEWHCARPIGPMRIDRA
ncbi:SOS response-associated peptidase [Halotalea alkalilenta]|uniref:Abasic site processing protein n=1 Tax=Halotalea alkalilenta TaxID=376489 RepID=A0A172YJW0_9GAMM|nr:SOS response-associated peptidase family protein [Halotalea alkalilenta]ANF59275.1 hypothetical protein A5892_18950 [Halotalea alkalilenta]